MTTSTRVTGPLGIDYDATSAAEPAIVSQITFGILFEQAREISDTIRDATSTFEISGDDSTYRVSLDGMSGYVVRSDGELVYVFSRVPGRGAAMIERAIADGATYLDCFDGYLPTFYARHGFVETRREANWTPGEPDVVFMSLR